MKRFTCTCGLVILLVMLLCAKTYVYAQTAPPAQTARTSVLGEGEDQPWSRGVTPAERQAALDLFLEGNKLFEIPLLARAIEKYGEALEHWKHPSIYFNLALAEFSLGQDVEAHANFAAALEYGAGPIGDGWYEAGKQKLAQLELTLGQVHIACSTAGAEVLLDGKPIFIGPGQYDGWARRGSHEVAARKPEYLAQARRFSVVPGEVKRLDIGLLTLSEAAENGRRWSPWISWTVVGAGVAVTVTGGVLHLRAKTNFDRYDDGVRVRCTQSACFAGNLPSGLMHRLDQARRDQDLAVAGYIAGGAILASGLVLLYLNRPRLMEQDIVSTRSPGIAVVPTLSPRAFGVSLTVNR